MNRGGGKKLCRTKNWLENPKTKEVPPEQHFSMSEIFEGLLGRPTGIDKITENAYSPKCLVDWIKLGTTQGLHPQVMTY